MNAYKERAINRAVSSDEWVRKSNGAGFAAAARVKKRQAEDAIKYAEIERQRQEYGVFLEVRNGVNRECYCNVSVAAQLAKGQAVFFSQPILENAANLLGLEIISHDAANETAEMVAEDGKSEFYEVRYAANMLRIQLQKAVLSVAIHP